MRKVYARACKSLILMLLRVPDIHEAPKHWFFTFFQIFLSSHDVSKIWMIHFWPRVHRLEKWSQSWKMPPGGRAEIESVKYAKSDIFNFNSATRWRFGTFTPLLPSMEHYLKKVSFRFLICRVLTIFTEILLHVYQVSLISFTFLQILFPTLKYW